MKLKKIFLCAIASLAMLPMFAEAPEYAHYDIDQLYERGFRRYGQSDNLELFFSREDCIIAVRVKDSGYVWYSSPLDWEEDEVASGFVMNTEGSILTIRAKDQRSTFRTANSIINVVRRDGLEVEQMDNGLHLVNDFTYDGILVPMDIFLDGDSLVVRVEENGIVETPSDELELQLLDIQLMPYFGAAPENEDGFIMVPDGSGALIRFNNGKSSEPYEQYIYGRDPSIVPVRKRNDFQTIALPVYGLSREGAGYIAIFEQGKTRGVLTASTAGQLAGYNSATPGFIIRDFDSISFRERTGTPRDVRIFERKNFETSDAVYSLRIKFLGKDENNLAGMANAYRNYLQDMENFPAQKTDANSALTLNFIGAGVKKKTVAGLPLNMNVAYSKYKDIQKTVENLKEKGVDNMVVKIDGWTSAGILGKYPSKAKPSSVLGGNGDFVRLVNYLNEQNIPVYAGTDFVNLYQTGVSHIKELCANRMVNRAPVKIPDYRLSTYTDEKTTDNYPYYILRTTKVEKDFNSFMKSMKKMDKVDLALDSMGNVVSSDFGKNGMSREQTKDVFKRILNETAETKKISLSRPFDYALGSASYVADLSTVSSRFDIENESVPFYQMLVQGYIPHSNLPANRSMSLDNYKLDLVLTGGDVSFLWITNHPDWVRDSRMQWFMDVYKDDWYDVAVELYKELSPVANKVKGATIVDFDVDGDVRVAKYDNGVEISVNYAEKTYKISEGSAK